MKCIEFIARILSEWVKNFIEQKRVCKIDLRKLEVLIGFRQLLAFPKENLANVVLFESSNFYKSTLKSCSKSRYNFRFGR